MDFCVVYSPSPLNLERMKKYRTFVTNKCPKPKSKRMSEVIRFIKERIDVFSSAARGEYSSNSQEMEDLGNDLFKDGNVTSPFATDRRNVVSDSRRIAADARNVIANCQL